MLQHSVSNKNAAANSQIKPLSLVPFCCVHTLAVVILEPLSTTDELTLFRTMAPPCNVCCPLPTSVATSSCLTVLVPRGDPSPTAPESRSAHAASPRLVVLDVGRGEGRRSCILLLDALPASVGHIILPLPDPVAPLRSRSCSAATTPPL